MTAGKIISTTCMCLALAFAATAADGEPPRVTVDGLHLLENTKMARVYAKPGVDLSLYQRVYLVKPQVAFVKDWQKTQNRIPNQTVTNDDVQRIKTELADLFMETFARELRDNGGYEIVEELAEDVLVVRPAIVDLNIFAPYTPRNRNDRSAMASVGAMTLYMELLDSTTGEKLVKSIDNKYDRSMTSTFRSNKDRNETAAREMLGEWAGLLRLALDEAREVVRQ